jgi:site-specific recombinase XerD
VRLSPKSILNIHTDLSAFWRWALREGYVAENLVRCVDPPPVSDPVVEPLTKDAMIALVKACGANAGWKTRPSTASRRTTADRDRAIVMLLLDTGIRASELCDIRIRDINIPTRSVRIRGKGPGRGPKERVVYLGARATQAVLRLLTPRLGVFAEDDHVFTVGPAEQPRPMSRNVLGTLLRRLGKRAGIRKVHPHRFRHTFAITYLRNQGDVFTLQDLLGHSDLAMVRRYARIAQVDCAQAHQRASPVDNWRL